MSSVPGNSNLEEDIVTLFELRDSLAGDQTLNWQREMSVFCWEGVRVAGERITELRLERIGLRGYILPEVAKLSSLRKLILKGNSLTGAIPPEIGNLSHLIDLSLDGNNLEGAIPDSIGRLSNLRRLFLGRNGLEGNIPESLGQLPNLEKLSLRGNLLTGCIPRSLGKLSKLRLLSLGRNQLTGNIPEELGNLCELNSLFLKSNRLTGVIPRSVLMLPNLSTLSLKGNMLEEESAREAESLAVTSKQPSIPDRVDERNRSQAERHSGQETESPSQDDQPNEFEKRDAEASEFYAYILKLDGSKFYAGHTRELRERMMEHRDGSTISTAGKNPRLVWFAAVETREQAKSLESELQRLCKKNPREVRRRILHFRDLVKELDLS